MKQTWNRFRYTVGAIAVMGASMAFAQTQTVPASPVAPVVQAAPAAPVAYDSHQHPAKQAHKPGHRHNHAHKPGHQHKHGKSAGKYASPQQHEAAAVAGERRRGVGPANPSNGDQLTEYQRNAFKRCEVFKTDDDRRACVERVRQPQISGSVEGGGVIREYTQTIQLAPAPQPGQAHPHTHAPSQVPHTDHMLHPPVQPVR